MATITKEIKELSKITSEEWKEWTMTVWNIANISDSVHPAVFPVEIPYRLLRMFSFWGETILDPFSGTGTTGEAALSNGRKYVGFETNSTYYERSTQRLLEVIQNKNIENANEAFVIHNHSCLDMASIPDNSIGAVITSPPYWNKADYGEYIGNIGGFEYYDDFIDSMESVVRESSTRKTAVFERKQRFFVTFLFIFFLTLFCQIVFDHITATDRKNRRPPELLFRRAVFCSQQAFSLARRGSSSFFISLISSASFCSHSSSVGA